MRPTAPGAIKLDGHHLVEVATTGYAETGTQDG